MSTSFPFGGQTQTIPSVGETGYGPELIQYWEAQAAYTFQNPADFSNTTLNLRQVLQTITPNSATNITVAPAGVSTAASLQLYSDSNLANGSLTSVGTDGSTQAYVSSSAIGTGTTLPLNINIGTHTNLTANIDGSVTFPNAVNLNGPVLLTAELTVSGDGGVTGIPTPINPADAANKAYVDSNISGLRWHNPVAAATTANLSGTYVGSPTFTLTNNSTQAAFAVDGYSASVNDRILVKNQSTNTQNGIYVVTTVGSNSTNWVLTRASDANTAGGLSNAAVLVSGGSTQNMSQWTVTSTVTTIDISPVVFTQFGNSGAGVSSIAAGTGIAVSASTGNVAVSVNQAASLNWTGSETFTPGSTNTVLINTSNYTPTSSQPAALIIENSNVYSNSDTYGSGAPLIQSTGIDNDQPCLFIQNNVSSTSLGNTAWLELINTAGGFQGSGPVITNPNLNTAAHIGGSIELISPMEVIGTLSTVGTLSGGSSYTAGTYTLVPLTTNGAGTLATATIVVGGGGTVTSVTITSPASVNGGDGYAIGDTISALAANIGGTGSGFSCLVATVIATNGKCKFGVVSGVTSPSNPKYIGGFNYWGNRRSALNPSGANSGFENNLRMYQLSTSGKGILEYDGSQVNIQPIYNFGTASQLQLLDTFNSTTIILKTTASGGSANLDVFADGATGSAYVRAQTNIGGASLYCQTNDTSSQSDVIIRSNWGGTAGTGSSILTMYTDNTSNLPSGWRFITVGTSTASVPTNLFLETITSGSVSSPLMTVTPAGGFTFAGTINSGAITSTGLITGQTIHSTSGISSAGTITVSTASFPQINLIDATGPQTWAIEHNTSSSFLEINDTTAGHNRLTIDDTTGVVRLPANVVSTTTTTGTLVVTGGVGVSGAINSASLATSGNIVATGTISSGGQTVPTNNVTPTITAGTAGQVVFPSGFIMKWGQVTVSGSSPTAVAFTSAFPTACVNVNATPTGTGSSTYLTAISASGFSINWGGSGCTYYWQAIGY